MLYAHAEGSLPATESALADSELTEQILEFVAGLSTPLSHDRRGRHGSEKRTFTFVNFSRTWQFISYMDPLPELPTVDLALSLPEST